MGLSSVISGGIILSVMLMLFFTIPGLTEKMFSIGDVASQVAVYEKAISDTEISIHHTSTLINEPTLNFTLSNDGQEKLWNYNDFNLFVTYDGTVSGQLTEEISYSGDCSGGLPTVGNWCIQSITGDMLDPGILNSAEEANIRVQLNEDLASVQAIVSITTDNGVTDTVLTPYCGPSCYQMSWPIYVDEPRLDWQNIGGPAGAVEPIDNSDHWQTMMDLTDMTEWRFILHTENAAGGPGCAVGVQYSTDNRVTWRGLDNGVVDSLSTNVNTCTVAATYSVTAWVPLNITAQSDVWLRVAGVGDNAADPDFTAIETQFRS